MRLLLFFLLFFCLKISFAQSPSSPAPHLENTGTSGYVKINGIKLFYKEIGKGAPILFLHGGLGTSEEHFSSQISAFSQSHRVITFHTRGHGKSEFDNTPFSYELFADDTYKFLQEMKIDSIQIVGFSDGGIVGALLAIQHPKMVKKLVMIGANATTDAIKPETLAWVKGWNIGKMTAFVKRSFTEHPMPDKLEQFVQNMQRLFLEQPNLKDTELKSITCPVLLIAGDKDLIKTEHQLQLHQTIPDSRLCILPGTGHDAQIEQDEIVNKLLQAFLKDDK